MSGQLLRAGSITAVLDDGALRWVRYDGHEVLRGIYVAVRDSAWRTAPGVITGLSVREQDKELRVEFRCRHQLDEIVFVWDGAIVVAESELTFEMTGVAETTFWANRIGICVLHPADVAGRAVTIREVTGELAEGWFPSSVSAVSPFTNVAGMSWEADTGLSASVRFDGDAFETEDQRNWTDASFKTFSRPLRLPKPVRFEGGGTVRQRIALTIERHRVESGSPRIAEPEVVRIGAPEHDLIPHLGCCLQPGAELLDSHQIDLLRAVHPTVVRAVLETDRPGWEQVARRARVSASAVGALVEFEVVIDLRRPPRAGFAEVVGDSALCVFGADDYTTPDAIVEWMRTAGAAVGRVWRIGGGSRAHLAELNRTACPVQLLDYVTFPISPQVHAFDDQTVMENVAMIPVVVSRAREVAPGLPLVVGPVTLRPRFNAYASKRPLLGDPQDNEARTDPRQSTRFAASWTIASLAELAHCRVETALLHEVTGPAGFVDSEGSELLTVMRLVGSMAGARRCPTSTPHGIAAVAAAVGVGILVLVANLSSENRVVQIAGPHPSSTRRAIELPSFGWSAIQIVTKEDGDHGHQD